MISSVPDSSQREYEIDDPIPFSKQDDQNSCVPHCLCMVLDHYRIKEGFWVYGFNVEDIKEICETSRQMATSYRHVENLNKELKTKSNPILTFYPDANYSWDKILEELNEKRPVIAYLKSDRVHPLAHSVIVRKYDPSTDEITMIDPKKGEDLIAREDILYIGDFLVLWENAFNILIPVSEGEVFQTDLEKVLKESELEND